MKKKIIASVLMTLSAGAILAQTGPGGVGSGTTSVLLWLDGKRVNADGTNPTIGSTVATWNDQSGNGVNVTQNIANVATYSANGVTFNNTGYLTGSDVTFPTGSNPRTVIVCASSPTTNADDVLFFYGTGNNNQSYGILKIMNTSGTAPNGIRNYFYGNDFDVAGGFTPVGTQKIITTTYTSNTQVVYVNNNAGSTNTPTIPNTTLGAQGVQIGGWSSFNLHSQSTIAEVIVYDKVLNPAERIIVNNYLAAKNNLTLAANDLYDEDTNGDYDFDVAGIGQATGGAQSNTDAQSSIVRISNAAGLGNGEYYIWGHDNGTLQTTTTANTPASVQARLTRIWRGSETGAITNFNVRFDLTGLGSVTPGDLRLLIDTDDDGLFSDETVGSGGIVSGAALSSGNVYQFTAVTGLNNNLRFTLATTNTTTTPLPVKLLNFSATPQGGEVILRWTTATEVANDYFTVERSRDGQHFESIGSVDGAGSSERKENYQLNDANPFTGRSYYRLSQTDYDGTTAYFQVVTVTLAGTETLFRLHPNPSDGAITILLTSSTGVETVTVSIYDLRGAEIFSDSFQSSQQVNSSISISTKLKLTPGIYFVKMRAGNTGSVQKLVVN